MVAAKPYPIPTNHHQVRAEDLRPHFDELRKSGPIHKGDFPLGSSQGWIVVGYDAYHEVLTDPRFSSDPADGSTGPLDYARTRMFEAGPPLPRNFLVMDGREHVQKRMVLAKHLTVKRVEGLRENTRRTIDKLLSELTSSGDTADLAAGFTRILPVHVLCDLLGAPVEEADRFLDVALKNSQAAIKTAEEAVQLLEGLQEYFAELTQKHRMSPGNGLISAFVEDTEAKGVYTPEELDGLGMMMLLAGHDATATVLGGAVNWMAHDRQLFERLKADPSLVPGALEEFLRWCPAGFSGNKTRFPLEDIEMGGVRFAKGDAVLPLVQAANFDPEIFENADVLDIERDFSEHPHVGFGAGAHSCPGQSLARMELTEAMWGVLRHFDSLEPVENSQAHMSTYLRGPHSLRVRWTLAEQG